MMVLLDLFITFFKIGLFTFGGGYAMLPLIEQQVAAKSWMSPELFIDFIAISESTPGPFAINSATAIGANVATEGGIFAPIGAFFATLGVVLPSFIIILIVAKFYEKFKNSKIVSGCMSGLRPAAIGLIGAALVGLWVQVFMPNGFGTIDFTDIKLYVSVAIFTLATVLAFKKVHPIIIICISAVIGIAAGYIL